MLPTPFGRVALTNGLPANGREGANQENLDLISVSHSVCVLFSDFCWGQLRYKQMDFKVVGLNKNLHNILMVQVFWDCKTGLKISEGIYLCVLGQAERQEIDLVLFFWLIGLFVCFSSSYDFKILLAFLIREDNLLLKLKLLPNLKKIIVFFPLELQFFKTGYIFLFSFCFSIQRNHVLLLDGIFVRLLLLYF